MLNSLIEFVFPSSCAVCGAKPAILCEGCEPSADPQSFKHEVVPGSFVFDYEVLAPILSDFKDKSMVAHGRFLGKQLNPIIDQLLAEHQFDCIAIAGSSRPNFKRRGFVPSKLILDRCTAVKKSALPVVVLGRTRTTRDQRGLRSSERRTNTANSMTAGNLEGKRVLLFDDVFTTGATMGEMIRAVRNAGGDPSYFCVLAKRL